MLAHMGRRDLSGQKYARLTAIKPGPPKGERQRSSWICRCHCGNTTIIVSDAWGRIKSCGCIKDGGARRTHGMSSSPTYSTWLAMRARCNRKKSRAYRDYGAKGIRICSRWNKFESFLADMGEKPNGKSLDRIDNKAGYSPENCRWATTTEQAMNRSDNHVIEFNGEKMPLTMWARKTGIPVSTLHARVGRLGWSIKRALTEPLRGYS